MKKSISLISILVGLLGTSTVFAGSFTDVSDSSMYNEALTYLKSKGVISGYADGSFKPFNTINRAEFMKIAAGVVSDFKAEGSNCFKDVGTEWFAKYICGAKSRGTASGYADGTFKPGQDINFVEAAKIITTIDGGEWAGAGYDQWFEKYVARMNNEKAIPTTVNSYDQKITRGEMAEMIYRLMTKNTQKPSMTMSLLSAPKSYFEGSLSYPSEGIPSNMIICADSTEMAITFCTTQQIKSSKYQYGLGYKLPVTPGSYNIYAYIDGASQLKGLYSDFVTCGMTASCKSHTPINAEVSVGQTISNINPSDWYASN